MTTLFISDLHLEPSRLDILQSFTQFMAGRGHSAEAVYILGDLFEAWIGDDFENPFAQAAKQVIKRVSDAGVPVFFMHGNRDFLVGEQFAQETGCTILPDPTLIDLYGTPTLLMHGDTLCTLDVDYLKFRAMVRSPQWQQEILSKSIQERIAIAQNLRDGSQSEMAGKDYDIMDVTPEEVIRVMREQQVPRLIHGHTHRPAVHKLDIDGLEAERIVLGDWHNQGWALEVDGSGYSLEPFTHAPS